MSEGVKGEHFEFCQHWWLRVRFGMQTGSQPPWPHQHGCLCMLIYLFSATLNVVAQKNSSWIEGEPGLTSCTLLFIPYTLHVSSPPVHVSFFTHHFFFPFGVFHSLPFTCFVPALHVSIHLTGCWDGGHMTNFLKWSKNQNCSCAMYLPEYVWIVF